MSKDNLADKHKQIVKQMRRGALEMCILAIISEGEVYPSDIIEKLKKSELIVVEGTLYPLLSRLKKSGLLTYVWRESNAGPPRKYYQITEEGKGFLHELIQSWKKFDQSVNNAIKIVQTNE